MRANALIGIAGAMGTGKTSVANYLAETRGCIPHALADGVRAALYELNPIVHPDGMRVKDVITTEQDWQAIKESGLGDEFRALLQRMGTDVGRKMFGVNVWLFATETHLDKTLPHWWHEGKGPQVVVHDIRFNNEAKWVHMNRGIVINVTRPALVPGQRSSHASEQGIDPGLIDYNLLNVGSLDELYLQTDDVYRQEFGRVRA